MNTVIGAMKLVCGVDHIDHQLIGMRPGEKIHEDMLAQTELPFTYEVNNKLLVVKPQYTRKSHTYDLKYHGDHFNSSLHLEEDPNKLSQIIIVGLNQ